ncbi:terminase small subunit [Roseomonas sp. KE0001]|uniref:terminase small subunit n=1 Tax=Roseomonas sp. KE0001 TaxID=2479201 RepID=UPI0018DFC4FA|nr:terminase small subunit [Roseomonas sp. KE0001]
MLVNKSELATILSVSLSTLHEWIRKDPAFPVHTRGSYGVEWQFDADQVMAHLQHKEEAELEAQRERRERLEQYRLPLTGQEGAAADDTDFTPQQALALVRKRRLELEMAREAGFLVQASEVREALGAAFSNLGKALQSLPGQIGRTHGLPEPVVRSIRGSVDTFQRNLVRDLQHLMSGMEQPRPAGDTMEKSELPLSPQ